jgi:hypothetical protein
MRRKHKMAAFLSGPLAVAVRVESRKLVDTRSARCLLFAMILIGLTLIALAAGLPIERGGVLDVPVLLMGLALPGAIVAPLLAILSVTSDWQYKDVMTFYALQPRRLVILGAKYIAVTLFATAVMAAICLLAVLVAVVLAGFSRVDVVYTGLGQGLWYATCAVLIGSISGAAVASALMSTPLAVVVVLIQSTVADLLIGLVPNIPTAYVRSSTFSNFLSEGGETLPALSSAVIWILVPAAVGAWRHRRRDVN